MENSRPELDLWKTRNQALDALEGSLQQEAEVLQEAFALLDECIERLDDREGGFAGTCGLTLIKARNLTLGCYSLALDGLAQEAGALLRPLIEALELLRFFRENPSRVDLAITKKLPKAGKIAQEIQGNLQLLREYLNTHASHFSCTFESWRHIVDFRDFSWKVTQPYEDDALRINLFWVFLSLTILIGEGAMCFSVIDKLDDTFIERIVNCAGNGFKIFEVWKHIQNTK